MADTGALDLGFDPAALKARYLAERDKRVRQDGNEQYLNVAGQFAHYLDDPYTERAERAPVKDHVEVAVIGGGFGGMLAAARLRKAGFSDIRMIETGGAFGGTWYWNRYPGAACDIESYIYLPLLEETGFMPKEKYTKAPEILAHSKRIAEHFNLFDKALLSTGVTGMKWNQKKKAWTIETDRGDKFTAQFVVMSNGPLNRPKLPGIPGVESFKGHSFHTSRWDYQYTGGGPEGGLTRLKDKVVGIIGTGATAVQCVPHLAAGAKHLYVFQRTPSSIDVRNDRQTDPDWAKSLEPGWQRRRMENFNTLVSGGYEPEDLVNDGWTDIIRNILFIASKGDKQGLTMERLAELAEIADFKKMEQVRSRVDEIIKDPAVAAALKPWYRQFCKRPTFNDDFLAAFNRPNVTLVDTSPSKGVQRLTRNGVVANDIEYPVDCVIFSTGFEIGTAFKRRIGFEINGRGGQSLFDYWADGFKTLHGHSSNGFPNWFYIGISQNALSVNMTAMFDDQAQHIAYIIAQVKARGATTVEPTVPAQEQWVATIRKLSVSNEAFLNACTPGYYNNEGATGGGLTGEIYAPGINAFNDLLAEWRAQGDLAGLHLAD